MDINFRKQRHTFGHYGYIAIDEELKTATKIFRKSNTREIAEKTFISETSAYSLAINSPSISSLVPDYFGIVKVESFIGQKGNDISDLFYTDLAYKMSYINGDFVDYLNIPPEEEIRIRALFSESGIHYINDSAVIIESGKVKKMVDFGIKEIVK